MKERDIVKRHIARLDAQEKKLLGRKDNAFIRENLAPMAQKAGKYIPEQLLSTIEAAFRKGFAAVFEKGGAIIEKTCDTDALKAEHDINDYAISRRVTKKALRRMDKRAGAARALNTAISGAEGAALGLLGIGLPDIPLFISVMLRSLYETALSYGFGYESGDERKYMLTLICAALADEEHRCAANAEVDRMARLLAAGNPIPDDMDELTRRASAALSSAMLAAKFIQGFAVIGVIGSVANMSILGKIGKYASLKYKKRYLLGKFPGSAADII